MIVGLTGSLGAGKDTILEYLGSIGFEYISLSNLLREEANKRGVELTRTNLQDLGNELRRIEGGTALAKRALAKMKPIQDYVIGGIRNPEEIKELKSSNNFFLVSIDAPAQLRFSRLARRNRESDPQAWEEFLKIDNRDKGVGEEKTGQQVGACMDLADFNIYNDGDIGAVHEEITKVIGQIRDALHNKQ